MDLIAHRGFAGIHPENTVGAVRAASDQADVVEVDLRRCRSGEVVVIHDETVDRVTEATGAVADFTATELDALNVLGSGQGVPTLAAVLEAIPTDVGVNLELKERELADDTVGAIQHVGNEVLISSFLPDALEECRGTDPATARALLFAEDPHEHLALARELGCTAVHPRIPIVDAIVEEAHGVGMAVNAWTVERPGPVPSVVELGVDGVVSDYPGVLGGR